MDISPALLVLVGLVLAGWTVAAGWMMLRASARVQAAETTRKSARRLARMIEEAPAVPMLVRTDGRIEGPDRLGAGSVWNGCPSSSAS